MAGVQILWRGRRSASLCGGLRHNTCVFGAA